MIDAVDGERSTERNVSAGGRRVGLGTYELADRPGGGTRVTFTYTWERAPLEDRVLAPMVRRMIRRALQHALDRLAGELERERDAETNGPAATLGLPGRRALTVS